MSPQPVVLTLIASRLLQDRLVETLLAHEVAGASGFTLTEVVGYGRNVEFRTTGEQISGRVRQIEIRAVVSAEAAREIVQSLEAAITGQRIAWAISPAIEVGESS